MNSMNVSICVCVCERFCVWESATLTIFMRTSLSFRPLEWGHIGILVLWINPLKGCLRAWYENGDGQDRIPRNVFCHCMCSQTCWYKRVCLCVFVCDNKICQHAHRLPSPGCNHRQTRKQLIAWMFESMITARVWAFTKYIFFYVLGRFFFHILH